MIVFKLFLAAFAVLLALPAAAEDTALLIQLQPDGRYTVWHAGAPAPINEDEILALEAGAATEGGRSMLTTAGLAQSFETPNGILIRLPALGPDTTLLIDRDACGGIKVWHSRGTVNPGEAELTELVLSALPDGGKRIPVGRLHAKAYSTKIGVMAVIWRPLAKPGR